MPGLFAEALPTPVAVQIIIACGSILTSLLTAYLAFLSNQKQNQAIVQRDKSEEKIVAKVTSATAEVIQSKVADKSILDTETKTQIAQIHKATNGAMDERFKAMDERLVQSEKITADRFDRLEELVTRALGVRGNRN